MGGVGARAPLESRQQRPRTRGDIGRKRGATGNSDTGDKETRKATGGKRRREGVGVKMRIRRWGKVRKAMVGINMKRAAFCMGRDKQASTQSIQRLRGAQTGECANRVSPDSASLPLSLLRGRGLITTSPALEASLMALTLEDGLHS